jgi:hypothetical protein
MYNGKTLFTKLLDSLTSTRFDHLISRYGELPRGRAPCTKDLRTLVFAQPSYHESLRDIDACLSAQTARLYHIGIL